ncbi:MAG: hypothetical protein HYV07_13355 [Deltaproteobacteria bacterium]|nr:hypothetical protein [Deltaproteobacteria bacterium]
MRWIAVFFTLLEALAAFWLGAVSRHGPAGLTWAAPSYLVLAPALTWWAARRLAALPRPQAVALLVGVGVLVVCLAPASLFLLDRVETRRSERRIAATRLSEVRDEPIISPTGQPIGVRLSFVVEVPHAGFYGFMPSVRATDPAFEGLMLLPVRWTVDGRPQTGPIAAGRHELIYELYPAGVTMSQGELCLQPTAPPSLGPSGPLSPLRVSIGDTAYGETWRGGREEHTRSAYSVGEMYRAVLSAELKPCPRPPS